MRASFKRLFVVCEALERTTSFVVLSPRSDGDAAVDKRGGMRTAGGRTPRHDACAARRMLTGPLFVISQALSRAASFVLGWATSLFFGQIPGGKERVVSMLSAIALAWVVLTYAGGSVSAIVLILERAHIISLRDPTLDDARIQAILIGIVALPPLLMLVAELSHLMEGISPRRWLRNIPVSYPVAMSLGTGVALMLLAGPIVLVRRRRAGLRTHHIPVLVADANFHGLVNDIADVLRECTGHEVVVGTLAGLWGLPMRAMRYAAERLFTSVVRADPVLVVAGPVEVAAFAMDVNVTAPAADAYWLRAALYKRFGVGHMHLTWSATSQAFERKLWELHEARGLSRDERDARLVRLEDEIDRAPIGSDEWNVLYRVVLQEREKLYESAARRSA